MEEEIGIKIEYKNNNKLRQTEYCNEIEGAITKQNIYQLRSQHRMLI